MRTLKNLIVRGPRHRVRDFARPCRPESATAATGAATRAATAAQPPTFRTGSNLVRVDVYPTRDGQPVTDLAAADFEISEDGVAQKVATFERVVVRPAGAQSEPSIRTPRRRCSRWPANPRNRVFVIFLDAPNVSVTGVDLQ